MFAFERAIPEEVSLSSKNIEKVLKTLQEKSIPMHSLLIMKNDKLIFEKYYAPYKADTLHRMFSISKSFTGVAIGLLASEGKVDLDAPITSYFPEYTDESTHPWIRQMTVRNLLMMRTCHAQTTYKVDMKSDWVKSFFVTPPTHKPGTVFHYDTSAAHVLCALVEKLSGKDMLTYLKDSILYQVDFSKDSYMLKDPFGVSMGGSGLMATPMDILKFLYILHKKGTVICSDGQERSLLPKEFVEEATGNLSDNYMTGPIPSEAQGYGMQIWQNEKGGFVLYGMGGQLAISIPSKDMLIVTTADTQGYQGGNQVIYDTLYRYLLDETGEKSCESDPSAYRELCAFADTLSIAPPHLPESYSYTGAFTATSKIPDFIRSLSGGDSDGCISLTYSLKENSQGFEKLHLRLSQDGASNISFEQKNTLHTIYFGIQSMCEGLFPIYENAYTAGAVFTRDNVLYIRIHLIGESVGSIHFQLFFEDREVTLFMKKIEETYFKEFDGHLYGRRNISKA
ncbi:serine hydrolase domain-containing protein [Butyrivibrio sp. AE2032]|uniref:serine hydrolase domain-containing protein n=1 Tax=Butyrivibrio sp. AE2032 TaxID=1458463 RepID=UPI0005500CD9|nr:serine hydrolase domain-containing protein [Butyrivibrio sp. AE2032]